MFKDDPYNFFRRRLISKRTNVETPLMDAYDYLVETQELTRRFRNLDIIVHDDWSLTGCVREREEK